MGSPNVEHIQGPSHLPAGNSRGKLTLEAAGVEGQTSWATLQTWVTTDAEPVSDATLLNGHSAIRSVLADGCKKKKQERKINIEMSHL